MNISEINSDIPIFASDTIIFGVLCITLALIFHTSSLPRFSKFYKIVPALLLCYFLPSVLSSVGLIADKWIDVTATIKHLQALYGNLEGVSNLHDLKVYIAANQIDTSVYAQFIDGSKLYYVSSRFLLPAALVLLTMSIDLKGVFKLGSKALIMFLTATFGVMIGGPLAILFFSYVAPDILIDVEGTELWKGLSTVAGSWIGGGANQLAMKEQWEVSDSLFSIMAVVDVLVAEVWMAFLLLGVAKSDKIDAYFKADNSSITALKNKMETFSLETARIPSFNDLIILLGIGFGVTSLSHFVGDNLSVWVIENAPFLVDFGLGSAFFWLIITATTVGVLLSFTKIKSYEGAGASKIGTVFIYILVASIGMKMNLNAIVENISLFAIGFVWMLIHVGLLFVVAKIIKAPYFFLAVGSKANIGGAASAPVVAGAFHPSLAPVGVLLAVLGYALGTYAAFACALMMKWVS
ncbi:DUF819 family protein [Algibacter amylolyticus]|uniref:DUF819 family protein n=1 Tax=Algibacter amylolyticus TaxID=1608400 RepID=A0A5M7B8H9_9FLAO|nr:DUF819 family protein [Algibacter amylolyticus]KAA5825689.1 DUF819 family protein [Algibacter amylolyticus]MBB5268078.1 putative membrane protein [Algibacter amylolyticus]TSJ79987.1 DUF819 family protein [Algibacter amylolyticus]